tara:strand:+ start:301 stop:558 length:258 start_codon:yes stop_codon:yes gene_type:complete
MRMPEDFTQMEYPFGGLSTDIAKNLAMSPYDARKEIIGHPGAYSDAEFRSAQRAENAIRKYNRQNQGQTQDGRPDLLKDQERGII